MYQSTTEEAWALIHTLSTQSNAPHGFGTMTPAPYDTAWVAMVSKVDSNGMLRPLFPEAYEYLKRTQSEDGSWSAETSNADGIINTLAALLALKKQERQFGSVVDPIVGDEQRSHLAEESLRRMLNEWDLEATDRVGMEILVPNLLKLLEAEGIIFDFPCRKRLLAMNAAKMARLGPVLTSPIQTTLIHTLEAFVGTLDFDKVKQHKMPNGSMLASPSSTAAYLMNASEWDSDAEAYLRMVFEQQSAMGYRGGFPSAFPSTIFETCWVLDVLLESGFDKEDFLLADVRSLTNLLETSLKQQKGIVGWAPSCLPDADDTAKTISALRLFGWEKEVEPMLKAFEAEASFITYRGERNASSTANCNVLLCLLRTPKPAKYTAQIVKCARFLCQTWMRNNGPDKWHTSVQYPMMLIAQSFTLLLKHWAMEDLDTVSVPKDLVYRDIPRTLLDILGRTMRSQGVDGSWESKREVTAYAILTLAPLLSLPWVEFLKPEGSACMYRGKAYLEQNRHRWREAERLWIEKTVYGSPNLSQAYCLAASKVSVPTALVSAKISGMFPAQLTKKMAKMSGFFSRVIPFSRAPEWKLQLSLLQSANYATLLKTFRFQTFPPIEKASDEKYQEYIPFTWIGCRDYLSTAIPADTLWDMMLVSMFNFQVDAYMETTVWEQYRDRLPELRAFIRSLCSDTPGKRKRSEEDDTGNPTKKPSKLNGVSKPNGTSNGAARANGASKGALNGSLNGTSNGSVNGSVNGSANGSANGPVNGSLNGAHQTSNGVSNRVPSSKTNGNSKHGKVDEIEKLSSNGTIPPSTEKDSEVKAVLTKFVNFALQHPNVVESPPSLRAWLAYELQTFLLAHITHMEDCETMAETSDTSNGWFTWNRPRTTFFNWVRTTSADHTSCPYSFVFFLCLIGENGRPIITNMHQRYALEDACRHLASMCRQYNDLGSIMRDQEEKNLNSVNFPEFETSNGSESTTGEKLALQKKRDLLAVAEYERRCLDRVIEELEPSLDSSVMEKLRLFVQVTDLYGQIYVARDIGIRRMEGAGRK